jgi:hypothetical protein
MDSRGPIPANELSQYAGLLCSGARRNCLSATPSTLIAAVSPRVAITCTYKAVESGSITNLSFTQKEYYAFKKQDRRLRPVVTTYMDSAQAVTRGVPVLSKLMSGVPLVEKG